MVVGEYKEVKGALQGMNLYSYFFVVSFRFMNFGTK